VRAIFFIKFAATAACPRSRVVFGKVTEFTYSKTKDNIVSFLFKVVVIGGGMGQGRGISHHGNRVRIPPTESMSTNIDAAALQRCTAAGARSVHLLHATQRCCYTALFHGTAGTPHSGYDTCCQTSYRTVLHMAETANVGFRLGQPRHASP